MEGLISEGVYNLNRKGTVKQAIAVLTEFFFIDWVLIAGELQNVPNKSNSEGGLIIGARGEIITGCIFLFKGRWSITEGGELISGTL